MAAICRTVGLVATTIAISAVVATTFVGDGTAVAGGFAIREQSTESQGASFAGNAAGRSLGVMYWNPAGAANKTGPGINTESNYALIIPRAELTVDTISGPSSGALASFFTAAPDSSEIGVNAIVPASYANYQINGSLFLGLGMNSGFGLKTEPEKSNYDGAIIGRTSGLFTTGATPTLAYVISPGITVGLGVQVSYAKGTFKFATGTPDKPSTYFEGSDFGFGGTAGVMLHPSHGTRIGLGWRSAVDYTLDGDFARPAVALTGLTTGVAYKGTAEVNLPDIVTLSINQEISDHMRLLGTVEWSNWSRFKELRVKDKSGVNADLVIPAAWSDGWFVSVGGEYDYSKQLTLRSGVGYEWSPIDDANKRLVGAPDANRVWASFGGTYKVTDVTSVDLAYTHVFFDSARFDRSNTTGSLTVGGSVEASTDIVSLGLKSKF